MNEPFVPFAGEVPAFFSLSLFKSCSPGGLLRGGVVHMSGSVY